MITLQDWQINKDQWLDRDLALMTTDTGWRKRGQQGGLARIKCNK